ncbi:alpha/beta hydrolase [uncultured Ruegeria sp.]|uniref:alpha/beta fold hydrolase n=1 Tax=uncultured Ruegeria sp. TaxID=259304 RepID=UPI00260E9714|nr:alpha/beta hydrolase [uncultured Ruegeria sp.]
MTNTNTKAITSDCPIHIEMHGDVSAPCIVMILGLGMQLTEWPRDLLQRLSRDFHLICVENRDMGLSGRCGPDIDTEATGMLAVEPDPNTIPYTLFDMRDDVLRVVDTLNIDQFAIVGFSMGGMIAQLVAAKAYGRVSGMVQICSSAGEADMPSPSGAWDRFLRTASPFDTEQELADWLVEDLIWWSNPTPLSKTNARAAALDMIAGGFSPGGYARQLLALNGSGDRQEDLKNIQAPALVIGGAQDRCIEPDSSRRAHELITGSDLVFYEGMGHALDPQALQHLENWLVETLIPHPEITAQDAGWRI